MKAEGTLSIDLVFRNPLAATINVLVYAEYHNIIEIDSNRNVIKDQGSIQNRLWSKLPGTHRIAIYFNEQMKGEFFYYYGKHPIHYNKHFLDFLNRNGVQWEHNKIQLQSAFSSVCGQYYK